MHKKISFIEYQPKSILNKSKRADDWFWTRYSAYPYIGCQHGCEFCYCRERKYSPYEDPDDFASIVKVKENAPFLLRRALQRNSVDVIFTGDYQPAEKKYQLSRKMLEVILEFGYPVFILERSPLVLRDIDLIHEIDQKAKAVVCFSIISTPDSPNYKQISSLEHLAPSAEKRFSAMEEIAERGILTGTCFMPILPKSCDDEKTLSDIVRWTADHGGQFVLPGGLTLADQQKEYFFNVLKERFPDLYIQYLDYYPDGSYSPKGWQWEKIALHIQELCKQKGIQDRIPRPIISGEKRARNKRIVEKLAYKVYNMELGGQPKSKTWAYRRAAWAIEDLEQDIGLIRAQLGRKGLESIPNIGEIMAKEIEQIMENDIKERGNI